MRILPLILVVLASTIGCHQRPMLMKGVMTMAGNMGMTGDMNMSGEMAMKGDMSTSMKTDNTASRLASVTVSGNPCAGKKIAIIDVDGLLIDKNIGGMGSMGENPVALFREKIDTIVGDPSIGGVVLRINSPGGGVTASDIMSHDLMRLKQQRDIPVVACLMVVGTGGGYYLATHADAIFAHPTTVVGGIGVILNRYNMEDTMGQFNILSMPIKAGEKVDAGTPERAIDDDEQEMLQQIADSFHKRFIDQVKRARIITADDLFDGRVMTGSEAAERNLIDHVGYLDDAIEQARQLSDVGAEGSVVMLRRDNDRAYTALDVTPNSPFQASLLPFKLPGLDRSAMPTFLYMWQPDPGLASVTGL